MTPTKAPKTTFTATYVHPTTGETITVTRTSHRIYTHGSVRGPYSDGAYGVTFHGSEAQAARKNEYGPVALVVELTSDRNYNDAAKAAAPVEPKTNKGSTNAVIHNLTGWYETDLRRGSINTDEAWTHMGDNPEDFRVNSIKYLSDHSNLRTATLKSADWSAVWEHFRDEADDETPSAPVVEAPAPVEVEQPGTVATKTTSKKKSSTKTTSTRVKPSTDLPAPGTGHLVGYARVSTTGQDAQLQRDALNAAGCIRIFEDVASGSKSADQRPQLAAALDYARPGDTVCVWKIDRLSRSLIDLVTIVKGLAARGVKFRELNGFGEIDPNSPQGALMLGVLGSVAEFERAIIRQRTIAGLEVARAEGRVGGRPSVIDEDKLAIARARRAKGESVTSIATALGVSRATLYNHLGAAESTSTTE